MSKRIVPREEVMQFALDMEERLIEHDDRGGWDDEDLGYLLERAGDELDELRREMLMADAYYALIQSKDALEEELDETCMKVINKKRAVRIIRECADTANFLMMLADRMRTDYLEELF